MYKYLDALQKIESNSHEYPVLYGRTREYLETVFSDLINVFDCVAHDLLINKLEHYGFSANSANLIQSYLSNLQQQEGISGQQSRFLRVSSRDLF